MKNTFAIVAVISSIVPLCRAASPPPVPESLLACRKVQDDGERVRCYDTQIAKLTGEAVARSTPAHAVPTAPAPTAPITPATAATPGASTAAAASSARFGEETLPPAAHPQIQQQEDVALLSSITALRKASSGAYTISLANGQVWRQEESSQVAQFLRVGDNVRIEKAAFGSYHLSTASTGAKNWVRVTRVR